MAQFTTHKIANCAAAPRRAPGGAPRLGGPWRPALTLRASPPARGDRSRATELAALSDLASRARVSWTAAPVWPGRPGSR